MPDPTPRLARRIRADFGEHADEVLALLSNLPETSQDPERIMAAVVLRSHGSRERLLEELELVALDWRDTLMGTGLEHADHDIQLDRLLGSRP